MQETLCQMIYPALKKFILPAAIRIMRKFVDDPCAIIEDQLNRLFVIEDSINKKYSGDDEKRKQLRFEKEKSILETFQSWLG